MAYGFTGPTLPVLIMMCVAYRILLTKILILLFLLENQRYVRSFCVRNAEVWESLSIIRQALEKNAGRE
jgi:NADH-quinone oxidoreductase subunit D